VCISPDAESDLMEAVGNWKLKVDLQEPLLMEYMNKMATKDAVTAKVCIATLKDKGGVNQIMNAFDFLEIKPRAIVVTLRNEARVTQLGGIVEKGRAEDGYFDGNDCLIRG
jgi:hypothetical protein